MAGPTAVVASFQTSDVTLKVTAQHVLSLSFPFGKVKTFTDFQGYKGKLWMSPECVVVKSPCAFPRACLSLGRSCQEVNAI